MREAGIIRQQTVLLDAEALGFEATFFVLIRTSEHEAEWQRKFLAALRARPELATVGKALAADPDPDLDTWIAGHLLGDAALERLGTAGLARPETAARYQIRGHVLAGVAAADRELALFRARL